MKPKGGAMVAASAASAVAAVAWNEIGRRHVSRADLPERHMRVERLSDLRHEAETMALIEAGLRREWAEFAFLGFDSLDGMAQEAGDTVFVVSQVDEGSRKPLGVVQTTVLDVHGDPRALVERYPTFADLIAERAWRERRVHEGDTAVLMQITVLGSDERGAGLGSLLRDAVLYMSNRKIKWALTTTPIDGKSASDVDLEDQRTFSAAMRFHAKGGARPALVAPGYKTREGQGGGSHGSDIIFMRYERDESGNWAITPPAMRVRRRGPIQERVARESWRWKLVPVRGRRVVIGAASVAAGTPKAVMRLPRATLRVARRRKSDHALGSAGAETASS